MSRSRRGAWKIGPARAADANSLTGLINRAYRGGEGVSWTTEAHWVSGLRLDETQTIKLLAAKNGLFLCARSTRGLLGCIYLRRQVAQVECSLFAVEPARQGRGVGKALLLAAETEARRRWKAARMVMWVLHGREEMLAYYRRRGYRASALRREFPVPRDLWRAPDLRLRFLFKPCPA